MSITPDDLRRWRIEVKVFNLSTSNGDDGAEVYTVRIKINKKLTNTRRNYS